MKLKKLVIAMLVSALAACTNSKVDEAKSSSDFATSAIDAYYSVEIMPDNEAHFTAKFFNSGDSLKLVGGDEIMVEIESENKSLIGSEAFGIVTYSLVTTPSTIDESYSFQFIRTTQESALDSLVNVPKSFTPTSPAEGAMVTAINNTFALGWDGSGDANPAEEKFMIIYSFDCRNESGSPSISDRYAEETDDDGVHTIDLNTVLGEGDYDQCSRFDITLIRSNANGLLDGGLKSGSTEGAQVRFIKSLTIEGIL